MEEKELTLEDKYTVTMLDVEELALREIADKRCNRNTVALTLAFGLRQNDKLDWKKLNEAMIARWSRSGREYIMNRAWGLVEGRIKL